jgi:hypothetical protein
VENLSIGNSEEIAAAYTKQSENKFFKIGMQLFEPAILVIAVKKGPPILVGLLL